MSARPRLTVVRTPAGNFGRLQRGLERAGASVRWVRPEELLGAEGPVVLPGVSAFTTLSASVRPARSRIRGLVEEGTPFLGICAGFQALFEGSEEGRGGGLGVLPGRVRRLSSRRVPHLGWSRLRWEDRGGRLMEGVSEGSYAYFAHSFRAPFLPAGGPARTFTVRTTYRQEGFPAAVERGPLWGLQFHPEVSGATGARVLANFVRLCAEVGR